MSSSPPPAPPEHIEGGEAAAIVVLSRELAQHLDVAQQAFSLASRGIATMDDSVVTSVPLSARVALVLLARITADLRAVTLLSRTGYASQAATVASSLYESSHTIWYIGTEDDLAREWLNYDDPTRPFRSARTLVDNVLARLGAQNPQVSVREYRVYRQLCMAKHVNPIYQRGHGVEQVGDRVEIVNGPDTSAPAIRAAWFALQHGARLTCLATLGFLNFHVAEPERRDPLRLEARRIQDEGIRKLNSDAVARWGSDDPFPGQWDSA